MNRRHLLTGLGVGGGVVLAGCLSQQVDTISDIDPDDPPAAVPITPSVAVEQRSSSPDRPVTLSIGWTNTSADTIEIPESGFSTMPSEDGTAILLTEFYADSATSYGTFRGCWRQTDELQGPGSPQRRAKLAPGESSAEVVKLFGTNGCLESRSYRFTTSFDILIHTTSTAGPRRMSPEWNWGFAVHIAIS